MNIIVHFLLYHLNHPLQRIEVARVSIHTEDVAIAVNEFVGGVAVHAKEALDGGLLLGGQVVVHHVVARHVVFLDDILPRFFIGTVCKIKVYDVVVLQVLVFLLAFRQGRLARAAPGAPNVKQDNLSFVGLDECTQYLLAIALLLGIVFFKGKSCLRW